MEITMKELIHTKRVAFIFDYDKANYKGGIASILDCYCKYKKAFEQNGYTVDWINLQNKYSHSKLVNSFQKIFRFLFEKRTLLKKIKKGNYDIIHFHSSRGYTLYKDLISAKYVKKKLKLPIVFTIHFANIDKILFQNKYIKSKEIKMFKNYIDRIICLSIFTSSELEKMICADKTRLLYTFHSYKANSSNFEGCEYERSKLTFLFMGSIDERKGIFNLIKVFKNANIEADLNICGGFGNDVHIKNLFFNQIDGEPNIHYCGYLNGLEKEKTLEDSDVLVLPSFAEGMPVVIMEAMSKGCAIIASDVGAIPEIITSENGILVKPGSDKDLTLALEKLYNDRALLQSMKRSNIEQSTKYSVDNHIKELTKIYKEINND